MRIDSIEELVESFRVLDAATRAINRETLKGIIRDAHPKISDPQAGQRADVIKDRNGARAMYESSFVGQDVARRLLAWMTENWPVDKCAPGGSP